MALNQKKRGIYVSYDDKKNGSIEELVCISIQEDYLIWFHPSSIDISKIDCPSIVIIRIKSKELYYRGTLIAIEKRNENRFKELIKDNVHRPPAWIDVDAADYKKFKSVLFIKELRSVVKPLEISELPPPRGHYYFEYIGNITYSLRN